MQDGTVAARADPVPDDTRKANPLMPGPSIDHGTDDAAWSRPGWMPHAVRPPVGAHGRHRRHVAPRGPRPLIGVAAAAALVPLVLFAGSATDPVMQPALPSLAAPALVPAQPLPVPTPGAALALAPGVRSVVVPLAMHHDDDGLSGVGEGEREDGHSAGREGGREDRDWGEHQGGLKSGPEFDPEPDSKPDLEPAPEPDSPMSCNGSA